MGMLLGSEGDAIRTECAEAKLQDDLRRRGADTQDAIRTECAEAKVKWIS